MLISTELEIFINKDNNIVLKREDPSGEYDDIIVITSEMVEIVCSKLHKLKNQIEEDMKTNVSDDTERRAATSNKKYLI